MPRLKPLWNSLADLSHRLQQTDGVFVACDYDGTLIPIADHPDAARPTSRTTDLLLRVSKLDGIHLAVLSGRRLEDLEKQMNGGRLFLAGSGGLETRDADGRRQAHLPPEAQLPEALRSSLEQWCQRFPGAWVEDKRFSYALHYRAVAPALQPAFGAGVRRRARPFRDKAQLVHGKRVFEVMPAVPWEKSAALRLWLESAGSGGLLLYFGDDTNDEPVYGLVRERNGIAVAVGRTVSTAEFALPSPIEVVWFLEWLEREWNARESSSAGSPETHAATA
jgi:trehalose-phosphatase